MSFSLHAQNKYSPINQK